MKSRRLSVFLVTLLSLSMIVSPCCVQASDTIQTETDTDSSQGMIGNVNYSIPEGWTEITHEDNKISYSISDKTKNVIYNIGLMFTPDEDNLYSSIADDMVYVLLSAPFAGFEKQSGYQEHPIGDKKSTFEGHPAMLGAFSYDNNSGVNMSCYMVNFYTGTGTLIAYCQWPTGNSFAETFVSDSVSDFVDVVSSFATSGGSSESGGTDNSNLTTYTEGMYKVGTDIPSGEYVIYADSGKGYYCVSSDANGSDIVMNDNFTYNAIITVNDGEYLDLSKCHAIPISENPDVDVSGEGTFLVGRHIPAGEYKLVTTSEHGYYCIYSSSRNSDIVANDNFDGQTYVSVSDGQYLVLSRCKFEEPPQKPEQTYTDSETIKKVQAALNEQGYDCGSADGIAGTNTTNQIQKYQTDKGLSVSGTINDELLKSLNIQ